MPAKIMADARRCEDGMSCDRDTNTGAIKSLLLDQVEAAAMAAECFPIRKVKVMA